MKGTMRVLWTLAAVALLGVFLQPALVAESPDSEIPAPRAPLVPRITSVDQLVPFAKILVQRDYIGQRLGWGIKGGERVLFLGSQNMHPWVVEAFVRALKELNCTVDVLLRDRPPFKVGSQEWADEALRLMKMRLSEDFNQVPEKRYPSWGGSGTPKPLYPGLRLSKENLNLYDVVIGPMIGPRNQAGLAGRVAWETPELLTGAGEIYPGEILDFIDQKVWEIVRITERVEISGLQGSRFGFTWFPEWWEIVDGTHKKIRSAGHKSTLGSLHPGRSEHSVFAGHLMLHPRYGAIEGADTDGVIVSQFGEWGPMEAPLKLHLTRGEIVKVEGGGVYGDFWRKALKLTADIQYPGYSRPGTAWMQEFSLGTNPKIFGPMEVEELKGVDRRDPMDLRWGHPRDRSGFIHAGYGSRGASWWALLYKMPVNHYHQWLPFITYDVVTRDGRKIRLIDKGYLTMLDDPEVRALAAKYGDPDKLLSVDWVPELTADGRIKPPKAKMVSYQEYVDNLPFKLDDPRLIYRIPEKLKKFYGEDRITYYSPKEYIDFYRGLGQIPVRRVQ